MLGGCPKDPKLIELPSKILCTKVKHLTDGHDSHVSISQSRSFQKRGHPSHRDIVQPPLRAGTASHEVLVEEDEVAPYLLDCTIMTAFITRARRKPFS